MIPISAEVSEIIGLILLAFCVLWNHIEIQQIKEELKNG